MRALKCPNRAGKQRPVAPLAASPAADAQSHSPRPTGALPPSGHHGLSSAAPSRDRLSPPDERGSGDPDQTALEKAKHARSIDRSRRINPWRQFVGALVPDWLLRRRELGQGPKLAYARLAQYAGKNGSCFPKQSTLAAALGVSERTAGDYVRTLVKLKLIESQRPGLGRANRYFFLDHPWADQPSSETASASDQEPSEPSAPDQQDSSDQDRQRASAPMSIKENHGEAIQGEYPHRPPTGDSQHPHDSPSGREEEIYLAYPKHVGKPAALRSIRRALARYPFELLLERTQHYATVCDAPAKFIPHPATWFGQERFTDDPATWRTSSNTNRGTAPAIVRPDGFGCGASKL